MAFLDNSFFRERRKFSQAENEEIKEQNRAEEQRKKREDMKKCVCNSPYYEKLHPTSLKATKQSKTGNNWQEFVGGLARRFFIRTWSRYSLDF